MERVAKLESLQEIIAEISEPAGQFGRVTIGGETVSLLCHANCMERKKAKEKPTPWYIGQPLTFPVIRPPIEGTTSEVVEGAIRGAYQGKSAKRKKK